MKSLLLALSIALAGAALTVAPLDADAKRLGGGKPAGMQRQAPPAQPARPAEGSTPPQQAAPQGQAAPVAGAAAPAAAGAAAAAGKRSWLGPVAGIAAGLGIAALMSHLGFGEGFANLMTMLLLAGVLFFVVRWLLRRFASGGRPAPGYAMAGGAPRPAEAAPVWQRSAAASAGAAAGGPAGAAAQSALPAGFDTQAFEQIAKQIFVRMQAANDAGSLDDLRRFTTPDLFDALRGELEARGGVAQRTDVLQLDAQIVEAVQEADRWIVSVRFSGLIREQTEAGGERFEEVWHLVRPLDGSQEWRIAGITPIA